MSWASSPPGLPSLSLLSLHLFVYMCFNHTSVCRCRILLEFPLFLLVHLMLMSTHCASASDSRSVHPKTAPLSFANFYHLPYTRLTSSKILFQWSESAQTALTQLKEYSLWLLFSSNQTPPNSSLWRWMP